MIEISKRLVEMLESAKPEDQEAALWYVVKVLLHEENHREDLEAHGSADGEPGNRFDDDVWSHYTEEGYMVPYLGWPDLSSKDWIKQHLNRAREVINDKSKTEEGRRMLPSLVDRKTADTINGWLDANPNITLPVN